MKYDVVLTENATQQLDEACAWYDQNAPDIAADWYNAFLDALIHLEDNPEQHGLARESSRFPFQIRELLFGLGKQLTHRAVFTLHREKVVVRSIRHLSRKDLSEDDL